MRPQLFVLHHAGGNSYSFKFLEPYLASFTVVCPELPGRGRRIREPLLSDFDLAAQDIYKQIIGKLDACPFFIYGHSMGGYLALRVCNLLERAGKLPGYIIVSGNAGPGLIFPRLRYLLTGAALKEELRRLGGVPDEVLDDEELFDFFEPILRADFEVAERHGLAWEPPMKAPIFAIMGDQEEKVLDIANWERFTLGGLTTEVVDGDHFFIHKHAERLAAIIRHCHDKITLLQA